MTRRFQEKVRERLSARGKSAALLADYMSISKSHLSRVLGGERPLDHASLLCIADFLECTPADLAAGTEVEDLARPAGAVIQRDTYEELLQRVQEAKHRSDTFEAELVAERERSTMAETALTEARRAAQAEADEGRAASNEAATEREARANAEARASGAAAELDAARATIRTREDELRQLRGQLAASQRQNGQHADQNEGLLRENAALGREVARLTEHLSAANRAVAQNYDAYLQAEAGRNELVAAMQAQQKSATATAIFSGLIGLGAGLLGSSSQDKNT